MSVTSCELAWSGATGSISGEAKQRKLSREYDAIYRVITNNARDQAQQIMAYFAQNGPWIGFPYVYANDYDGDALLHSISPVRDAKSAFVWQVTCHYKTLHDDDDKREDEDGNETDDPLKWRDEIDISFTQLMVPVEKAKYLAGFVGQAAQLRRVGSEGPEVNSAFVPFDPPREKEISIRVVRIVKRKKQWDSGSATAWIGRINERDYTLSKPKYNLRKETWPKHHAKLVSYGGSFHIENDVKHWRIEIEIHVNPLGWNPEILDRGVCARATFGDPDGRGGTLSSGDLIPGRPEVRRLVDADEVPIDEPVLLDGDGQPLALGQPPVYLTYQELDEMDFAQLKL